MLFVDGIRQSKEEKEGLQRQAAGEVEIEGMECGEGGKTWAWIVSMCRKI